VVVSTVARSSRRSSTLNGSNGSNGSTLNGSNGSNGSSTLNGSNGSNGSSTLNGSNPFGSHPFGDIPCGMPCKPLRGTLVSFCTSSADAPAATMTTNSPAQRERAYASHRSSHASRRLGR
jgi:hypothetical protein